MAAQPPTKPVENSIAKVNDELDIGADLDFQRRWWRFEKGVWIVFTALLVMDLLGVFGRGPVAKARLHSADGTVQLTYERIARYSTPSVMTLHFSPQAIQEQKIQLWVSDSIIRELGNQRVVPQPASSALSHQGILYTFPSASIPDSVEFSLEPKKPGLYRFGVRATGSELLTGTVFVMP